MTVASGEPVWLTLDQVLAVHARQLARFGGAGGLRDEGLLLSALDRPRNKWLYEKSSLAALAATTAFGFAKNHAFVDGNKRVAFLAMMLFLRINGVAFAPAQDDATETFLALAAGDIGEQDLTRWIEVGWPKGAL